MSFKFSQFAKQWIFVCISLRRNVSTAKATFKSGFVSGSLLSLSLWKAKPLITQDDLKNFMSEPLTPIDQLNEKGDSMKSRFELFILKMQKEICQTLEDIEIKELGTQNENKNPNEGKFKIDRWTRGEGGGGITCTIQDGIVFEKAGVNISVVHGKLPLQAAEQMRSRGKKIPENTKLEFFAAGISSIIHPRNPNVPTIHFNYRYFEVYDSENTNDVQWWFGGGTDMTPYILDQDDAKHFHKTLKAACDKHDKSYYSKLKKWCDNYFFIKHRNERR